MWQYNIVRLFDAPQCLSPKLNSQDKPEQRKADTSMLHEMNEEAKREACTRTLT
jgi:hypothetical protein